MAILIATALGERKGAQASLRALKSSPHLGGGVVTQAASRDGLVHQCSPGDHCCFTAVLKTQ